MRFQLRSKVCSASNFSSSAERNFFLPSDCNPTTKVQPELCKISELQVTIASSARSTSFNCIVGDHGSAIASIRPDKPDAPHLLAQAHSRSPRTSSRPANRGAVTYRRTTQGPSSGRSWSTSTRPALPSHSLQSIVARLVNNPHATPLQRFPCHPASTPAAPASTHNWA